MLEPSRFDLRVARGAQDRMTRDNVLETIMPDISPATTQLRIAFNASDAVRTGAAATQMTTTPPTVEQATPRHYLRVISLRGGYAPPPVPPVRGPVEFSVVSVRSAIRRGHARLKCARNVLRVHWSSSDTEVPLWRRRSKGSNGSVQRQPYPCGRLPGSLWR
jgi:hypothetical protein